MQKPLFLVKLLNYEYWHWWAFYLPLTPVWIYQALRTRSFAYFTSANPFIEMGGFYGESKINILNHIADEYKPKTLYFGGKVEVEDILQSLQNKELNFPIILKPNVGERGNNVEKIEDEPMLQVYLADNSSDLIVQEYVDFSVELGVLYVRMPGEKKGKVTSVTLKEFMSVTGDGVSTIEQLMEQSDRARFQLDTMRERLGKGMNQVLAKAEVRQLEPIGNHCRGTKFLNANHLINHKLHQVFDRVAVTMPDFHYGRFDMRVKSYEDLYEGRNIRILELNGATSEPGHVYDPSYTLWKAYRDIAYHMNLQADICIRQRKFGIEPTPFHELIQVFKEHFFLGRKKLKEVVIR